VKYISQFEVSTFKDLGKYLSVKQRNTLEQHGNIFIIFKSEIIVSLEIKNLFKVSANRSYCTSPIVAKSEEFIDYFCASMLSLQVFLPSCLGSYARYFRNCAVPSGTASVSLALYLHANVLDAPYLSSLIILKAAANQRNARLQYSNFSSGRGPSLASLRLFFIAS